MTSSIITAEGASSDRAKGKRCRQDGKANLAGKDLLAVRFDNREVKVPNGAPIRRPREKEQNHCKQLRHSGIATPNSRAETKQVCRTIVNIKQVVSSN